MLRHLLIYGFLLHTLLAIRLTIKETSDIEAYNDEDTQKNFG